MPPKVVCTYEIDRDDRLTSVSAEWDRFAAENGAPELQSDTVLGRPLWAYIDGADVRHIYEVLFSRIRRDGRERALSFRCDGPDVRRYMRLTLRGLEDGALGLSSVMLREEPRESVPLLDIAAERSERFMEMCAWCKRVPVGADWFEVEEAIERLALFETGELPRITHVICPHCRNETSSSS